MRKIIAIATLGLTIADPISAANVTIEVVPSGWRMQDYISSSMVAYFTGSSCVSGAITIPSSTSEDQKNRFWDLVWNAKREGRAIGVIYDNSTSDCNMKSFYMIN